MRQTLSIAGLVLLAATVIAGAFWYGHRDEPVELLHLPFPPTEIREYSAALAEKPRPTIASDAEVRSAWEALHRAEVEARQVEVTDSGLPDQSVAMRAIAWEVAAQNALQETTPELFMDLGRRLGLEFIETFASVLPLCSQARLEPLPCLSARADDPTLRRFVGLGGLFLELAARGGFVTTAEGPPTLTSGHEPMLQAVFLDHWSRAVRGTYALESLMTPQEMDWLRRWKAEWQLDGNTERRVESSLALAHVQGYPAELNAGVLLYQAGQYRQAAEHFARAPQPIAALYARLALSAAESKK